MTQPTEALVERLGELYAAKSRTPWLIHSEPDVNYPPTIHKTHPLGNVGDPVEPFDSVDQELVVEAINALPTLLSTLSSNKATIEGLEARVEAAKEALKRAASDATLAADALGNSDDQFRSCEQGFRIIAERVRAAAQWLSSDGEGGES